MPKLVCQEGEGAGAEYVLQDTVTLGRKKTCGIVVDDGKCSREHSRVVREGAAYFIEDLKSANGTYLNDLKITRNRLAYGDKIRLGRSVFVFLEEESASLVGRKVGSFQFTKRLGPRGLGIVYQASQPALEREVAIKVLDKDYAEDKEFIERFIGEARQAGKVYHPNVIQVFDVGSTEGIIYVAMEFISGRPVRDSITGMPDFPVEDAVNITREIASAMDAAHKQQVIHREITPANIILTREKVAKLAELGITKENRIDRKDIKTLYYLSPEEARGMTPDDRSDVYSLGVCLFEMLAGSPPFKGEAADEIVRAIAKEPLPDLRAIRPQLPEELAALVEGMCAKLPRDRVQSMAEVVEKLDAVKNSLKNAPAAKPAPAPRATHSPRRHPPRPRRSGMSFGAELVIMCVVCVILFFIFSLGTQIVLELFMK